MNNVADRRPLAIVHAFHDGVQSLYTGVGRVAQNICWTFGEVRERALEGLDAALHLVTVAYPETSPAFRRDVRAEALDVVRRYGGSIREVPTAAAAISANEIWGNPQRWRLAGEHAADQIREIAADYERTIVFAHDIMFASVIPALAARSDDRIWTVWVPHSTARIHRYGEIDEERELLERETAAVIRTRAGAFAGAVGTFMAEHLNTVYGIPRDSLILLRNGIVRSARAYPRFSATEANTLLAAAGIPSGSPLVLFFGRCIPHKGVDLVLDAFSRHNSAAHLLLIAPPETGSTEYVAETAARVAELGGRATGILRFDPLLPFAALSSPSTVAVLVPSRSDPCPLTVMEAKLYAEDRAFGIIMSAMDGLEEQAVPGGTIVVELDAAKLATAIEKIVHACDEERRHMSKVAHDSLRSWDFAPNHAAGVAVLRQTIEARSLPLQRGQVPRSLHVEPSAMCNLRCTHCRGLAYPRILLSFARFEQILGSFLQLAVPEQIHFCGTGEPLLNPDTPRMWEHARVQCPNASLKLTTNFSLAIEALVEPILDWLDVVSVSVDGASAETYEIVRRNGDFERVRSNLALLSSRRRRARRAIAINVTFTPSVDNLHEIAGMPAFCASVGADALLLWRISNLRDPVYDRLAEWRAGVAEALLEAKRFGLAVRVAPMVEREARLPVGHPSLCRAPAEWLNVTASGRIAPCCEIWEQSELENLGLPIVPESDVVDAWKSECLAAFRHALAHGDSFRTCRDCHWYHHPLLDIGEGLLRMTGEGDQ